MDDIDKLLNDINHNNIISYGEHKILNRLYNNKELRRNINILEEGIPLLSKISYSINNNKPNTKLLNMYNQLKDNIKYTLLQVDPPISKIQNISGPSQITYLYSNYFNKNIILIGEYHDSIKYSCIKDSITIENYVNELFKQNISIDLFLEYHIPINLKKYLNPDNILEYPIINDIDYNPIDLTSSNYDDSYLTELRILASRKYKKLGDKKRIHFTDIRDDINTQFYKVSTISSKLKSIDIKEYKRITEGNHNYILGLRNYIISNGNIAGTFINGNLWKEFEKFTKTKTESKYIEVGRKIKEYVINYIDQYLKIYNSSTQSTTYIYELFRHQFHLNAVLSDIYTILRIFKNDEFRNCILYYGLAHIENINKLLYHIGNFTLKVNKFSETYHTCKFDNNGKMSDGCNEVRCVKNIIKFDDFFRNPITS